MTHNTNAAVSPHQFISNYAPSAYLDSDSEKDCSGSGILNRRRLEGDCSKGCLKYFVEEENSTNHEPKQKIIKRNLKVKRKTKIRIEQIIADRKNDRITLNLTKISETNLDNSTSKRHIVRANQVEKLNHSDDSINPLYTSILNSQKVSTDNLHKSESQRKNLTIAETIKKIRKRVRTLIKQNRARPADKYLKKVVNTYANRSMIKETRKAHQMILDNIYERMMNVDKLP